MSGGETDDAGEDGISDGTFAEMVQHLRPSWTPVALRRVADGVNATAVVDVETLDLLLADGGYFPDLGEDPDRFDDLVPRIRRYLRETVPDLPPPDPPTYCHKDYRYGNLVVAPTTRQSTVSKNAAKPAPLASSPDSSPNSSSQPTPPSASAT